MRWPDRIWRGSIVRVGVPCGVAIALLGSATAALQAQRHALEPAARWLVVFTFLFVLVSLALLVLVAYRAARASGWARDGLWTSAVAMVPPTILLVVVSSLRNATITSQLQRTSVDWAYLTGLAIGVLLFAAGGALAGALVGIPGALVGRVRFRQQHPEEMAERAAARAAEREAERARAARRRRRTRLSPLENIYVALAVVALVLAILVPLLATELLYAALARGIGLAVAVAALLGGGVLVTLARRTGRVGYVLDWVGLMALGLGVQLAIGELTGYDVGLISGASAVVWFVLAVNRSMAEVLPGRPEPPEQAPVLFRHDGEGIVVYPSRRKLATHAAFAGGVMVVFAALAWLFRSGGVIPVVCLGAFSAMGLFGFVPDVVRLVWRWPSLIVNSDGIVDRASGGIVGFGLIPWHEIGGVFAASGALRGGRFPELMIVPHSFKRLLARQHPLKRPLLRLCAFNGGGLIPISSLLLSQPPRDVARQIDAYVAAHAPPGYIAPDEPDAAETAEAPALPTTTTPP